MANVNFDSNDSFNKYFFNYRTKLIWYIDINWYLYIESLRYFLFLFVSIYAYIKSIFIFLNISSILTASLWFQNIKAGGSGLKRTTQVKLIVLPRLMYKSGAPKISVFGSEKYEGIDCLLLNITKFVRHFV